MDNIHLNGHLEAERLNNEYLKSIGARRNLPEVVQDRIAEEKIHAGYHRITRYRDGTQRVMHPFCPTCHTRVPATGVCGYCDE